LISGPPDSDPPDPDPQHRWSRTGFTLANDFFKDTQVYTSVVQKERRSLVSFRYRAQNRHQNNADPKADLIQVLHMLEHWANIFILIFQFHSMLVMPVGSVFSFQESVINVQ
jgi:hypothetical protein